MSQINKVTDPEILKKLRNLRGGDTTNPPITKVTDPEILKKLREVTPPKKLVQEVEQDTPEPPYLERLSAIRDKRQEEMLNVFEKLDQAEMGYGSAALQTVGKGIVGTGLDIVGESVATVASQVTPEFVQDAFKDSMAYLISQGADTEVVKEAKQEWDKLDTVTKGNIESVGNILTVLLPKLKVGKAGSKIKNAGEAVKKGRIADYMKLPETSSNKFKEAQRFFKEPVGNKQMVDTVFGVKGFKETNSAQKNLLLIGAELKKQEAKLEHLVGKVPKPVDRQEIFNTINKNLDDLLKEHAWVVSDKSVQTSIVNNIKAAEKILNKHPQTTKGLVKARREIDKFMQGRNGKNKLDLPASELSARDAVTQVVRRSVNEVIEAKHPGQYSTIMNTEHNLLKAVDVLSAKYASEATSLSKATKFAKQHPILTGQVLNGAGMVVGLFTNPLVIAGSAGAGAAHLGYRGLPNVLKGMGSFLEVAETVGTKTPMIPSTRAAMLYGYEEKEKVQKNGN